MSNNTEPDSLEKKVIQRIHEALEACAGNRIEAAEMLGISMDTLKNRIKESQELRRRWYHDEAAAPDDVSLIDRVAVPTDAERQARAYEAESKKFRKNLAGLPLNSKEIDVALALQRLNQGNFKELLDIANASMGMTVPKLIVRLTAIEERLEVVTGALIAMGTDMTEERVYLVEEEKSLSDQYLQSVETLRKIQQSSFEGSKTLALIKYKIRNGAANAKKAKPGFQAIDV